MSFQLRSITAKLCKALEIGDTHNAVGRLDEDEKGTTTSSTLGGEQDLLTVSEPGLYSIILRSRKPQAKAFKRWVTHDVIPSIRKHGMYATTETINAILDNPDFGTRL